MLSDLERLHSGERSILKADTDTRVCDVVEAFRRGKNSRWYLEMSEYGLSGSHITKKVPMLKCTKHRPNSIVKSVEELTKQNQEDGSRFGATGADVIARLMTVLVDASVLIGPDDKSRYRPGQLLMDVCD